MIDLIWALAALFLILWAAGLATSYTFGGIIHVLLVLAVVAVFARIILGRRIV